MFCPKLADDWPCDFHFSIICQLVVGESLLSPQGFLQNPYQKTLAHLSPATEWLGKEIKRICVGPLAIDGREVL